MLILRREMNFKASNVNNNEEIKKKKNENIYNLAFNVTNKKIIS